MIWTLVKVRMLMFLNSIFGGSMGERKNAGRKALIIVAFAYMFILFTSLFTLVFGLSAELYFETGNGWLLFGLAGIMSFVFSLMGSVFVTQNHLYTSNDNDMLLSMPITSNQLYISRLTTLFIIETISVVPIYIGINLGYIINFGIDPLIILLTTISIVLIMALVVSISSLLAFFVTGLSAKVPFKGLFKIVGASIMFAVYMYIMLNIRGISQDIADNYDVIGSSIRTYGRLFFYMGKGIADKSLVDFLIFVVLTLIPFTLVTAIIGRNFIKLMTTKQATKKKEYKGGGIEVSGAFSSLLKKELGRIFGTPMFLFNYGNGTIMALLLSIYLFINKDDLNPVLDFMNNYGIYNMNALGDSMAFILSFLGMSVGLISSCLINLEGKRLWILKTSPVREIDILNAKLLPSAIIGFPAFIVSGILIDLSFGITGSTAVLVVVFPCILLLVTATMGLLLNLWYYKLDWTNESYAYKNTSGPMITSLIGVGGIILLIISYVVIFSRFTTFKGFLIGANIAFLLAFAILYNVLRIVGVRKFREIIC